MSVRVNAWIQLCVDVRVAGYVFVGASENEGFGVGGCVDVNVRDIV